MSIKKVFSTITDKSYGFLMMEKHHLSHIFKNNNEIYNEEEINDFLDNDTLFNRLTLDSKTQRKKIIAVFYAIAKDKLSLLKNLTKDGLDFYKNKNDFLSFSALTPNVEIMKYVLSFFDIKNLDGVALSSAITYSREKNINYLLENGDKSYKKESHVLLSAIMSNNIGLTKFLLDNDCAINLKDSTILRAAIDWEDEQIIRKLILRGADIFVYDNEINATIWSDIVSDGNFKVLKILNECGIDLKINNEYLLKYACLRGNSRYIEIINYLIEHGSNIHIDEEYCLNHAAQKNNKEVVLLLLNSGARIENSKIMTNEKISIEMKEKINQWSQLQKLNILLNKNLITNKTTPSRKKL